MADITSMDCCGWGELNGVQYYQNRSFNTFIGVISEYSKGAFLFSSAHSSKAPKSCGARRFAAALEKREFGTVTALPVFRNPNTENYIISYMWIPDWVVVNRYVRENNIKPRYGYY